jgi:hypothetical protein
VVWERATASGPTEADPLPKRYLSEDSSAIPVRLKISSRADLSVTISDNSSVKTGVPI